MEKRTMAKNETYEEFVEKFKHKKTTDNCYTPEPVYNAISQWVAKQYSLNESDFIRPFYPDKDYKQVKYNNTDIVVDNPPFSILSEIVKFYVSNQIKFFLFCPTMTSLRYSDYCTLLITDSDITYENGACINTSFITNLEPYEIRVRTEPELSDLINKANQETIKKQKKALPKYCYPDNVLTASNVQSFARFGIDFKVPRSECLRISSLESQRPYKKSLFGCGLLISDNLKNKRNEAKLKANEAKLKASEIQHWKLSEREIQLIKSFEQF